MSLIARTACSAKLATLLATACLLLVGLGSATPANAACTRYQLIGAAGSGQRPGGSGPTMGPEVSELYNNLASPSLLGADISRYVVDYPAVGVFDTTSVGAFGSSFVNASGAALHLGFLGRYTDSVRAGTQDAVAHLEAEHAACPSTRFILSGYSQGAQALADGLQRNPADQSLVVAAAFFGDPYFNASSWSSRSSFDSTFYGLLGVRDEYPSALHGRIFSYCHRYDPMCNISNRYHILGDGDVYVRNFARFDVFAREHVTPAYMKEKEGDTVDAARSIASVLGVSPPASRYSGPLDIAFAIDSTGSMGDVIGQVQQNVTSLVNDIKSVDSDFRVALVDYKDSPDQDSPYQSRVDTPFTTDVGAFSSALDGLSASGGGDTPESVYSGVMTSLGLSWRNGAKKLVIQIGDAAAKDPEPVTGYKLDDVRRRALAVDPAAVDTIQPGTDSDAQSSLTAIADATGGRYLQLSDRSDLSGLVPAIKQDVESSAMAPTAALFVPATAIVGSPTSFSAGASTDSSEPIVGYDWDFNGDGVYDLTTTDPVTSHTYDTSYAGNVTVRVRAKSGLSSLASSPISVVPPVASTPLAPTGLGGAAGDSAATLSWSEPTGGGLARWFTIYDGHGAVLDRIAANPDGSVPSAWQDIGLTNGQTYTYSVSAGNERGEGPIAGPVSVVPTAASGGSLPPGGGSLPSTSALSPAGSSMSPAPSAAVVDAISRLRLTPSTFVAAASGATVAAKARRATGTIVSYRGTQLASTVFFVQRLSAGRLQGRKCTKASRRNRGHRACVLYITIGKFVHVDSPGTVRFKFTGRIGNRKLTRGRYVLSGIPVNQAGKGHRVQARFRIKG